MSSSEGSRSHLRKNILPIRPDSEPHLTPVTRGGGSRVLSRVRHHPGYRQKAAARLDRARYNICASGARPSCVSSWSDRSVPMFGETVCHISLFEARWRLQGNHTMESLCRAEEVGFCVLHPPLCLSRKACCRQASRFPGKLPVPKGFHRRLSRILSLYWR